MSNPVKVTSDSVIAAATNGNAAEDQSDGMDLLNGLYVVTKEKMSEEELDRMSMNASKEIGMGGLEIAYFPNDGYDVKKHFHVDVRCLPMGKLDGLIDD